MTSESLALERPDSADRFADHPAHVSAVAFGDLGGLLLVGMPNESLIEDWPHIDRQGRRTWHIESVAASSFDGDEPLVTVTAADRL